MTTRIFEDFADFLEYIDIQNFKEKMLCIDYGLKKVGLAVSDASLTISTPYSILERKNDFDLIQKIVKIIEQNLIKAIIIGFPMTLAGNHTSLTPKVISFALQFEKSIELPIVLYDERMSTKGAINQLYSINPNIKNINNIDDKYAASYVLQGVLERIKNIKNNGVVN